MLLLGRSVFAAKTYDQILVENRQCGFRLEGPEYLGLESSAYGLLKDMLEISPVARITAAEALRHAFFEEQVLRPVSKTKSSLVREPSLKKMRSVENMRVGGGNGSIEPLRLAIKHTHSIHEQQLQSKFLK
jgi:serine/threonine protein kinase